MAMDQEAFEAWREVQKMRRIMVGLVIGLVVVALLSLTGIGIASSGYYARLPRAIEIGTMRAGAIKAEAIEAHALRIVDERGAVRASLCCDADDRAGLSLWDEFLTERARLGLTGDGNGFLRIQMEDGGVMGLVSNVGGGGGFTMIQGGIQRLNVFAHGDGEPGIRLMDSRGTVRWAAGFAQGEVPGLSLHGGNGNGLVQLIAADGSRSGLAFCDKEGRPRSVLEALPAGDSALYFVGKRGYMRNIVGLTSGGDWVLGPYDREDWGYYEDLAEAFIPLALTANAEAWPTAFVQLEDDRRREDRERRREPLTMEEIESGEVYNPAPRAP